MVWTKPKPVDKRAKCGSGGLGFLVHNRILTCFNVEVLDNDFEGMFWLMFTCKKTKISFTACAYYLPPINSTHSIDVAEFYDTLLESYIYTLKFWTSFHLW